MHSTVHSAQYTVHSNMYCRGHRPLLPPEPQHGAVCRAARQEELLVRGAGEEVVTVKLTTVHPSSSCHLHILLHQKYI